MKACIIAVGTELTSGQIINRNSAWIAKKLNLLNIECSKHICIPDNRGLIFNALEEGQKDYPFLFVTGGLGPTADDFTREVIASWLKRPLVFSETSWVSLNARLNRLKIRVASSNRQQCFFPEGAEILANPAGTAAGFSADFGNRQKIWILPGPPKEIEAIWNLASSQIEKDISERFPDIEPQTLFTWQCLGKSEAELGEWVEDIFEGSDLQTGYRAHFPYIEIKIWCPTSKIEEKQSLFQILEERIAPWLISSRGEDLAELFLKALPERPILIDDGCTEGLLQSRLSPHLREMDPKLSRQITFLTHSGSKKQISYSDFFKIELTISQDFFHACLRVGNQERELHSPYQTRELRLRTLGYFTEKALYEARLILMNQA